MSNVKAQMIKGKVQMSNFQKAKVRNPNDKCKKVSLSLFL